jgi:predicted outer membrane repeat protein
MGTSFVFCENTIVSTMVTLESLNPKEPVLIDGCSTGLLTINKTTITMNNLIMINFNNWIQSIDSSSITINNCTFDGSQSLEQNITYMDLKCTNTVITNSIFRYFSGFSSIIDSSCAATSFVSITNTMFLNNTSPLVTTRSQSALPKISNLNLQITRSSFVGNVASMTSQGAWLNIGSNLTSLTVVSISECLFTNNTGRSVIQVSLLQDSDSTVSISNSTFSYNYIPQQNTLISLKNISSVAITDVIVEKTTDNLGQGADSLQVLTGINLVMSRTSMSSSGGNTFNKVESIRVRDCSFNDVFQDAGTSTVDITSFNDVIISNSNFTNCGVGGATHFNSQRGSITVTNCRFINNRGSVCGGAIDVEEAASSFISNCYFEGNTAPVGGAVDNYGSAMLIQDSIMRKNIAKPASKSTRSAQIQGGAYYAVGGALTISSTVFEDNSCQSNTNACNGGAMYFFNMDVVALQDCSFIANTADNGGAIFTDGIDTPRQSVFVFSGNNTFKRNSAEVNGGGIVIQGFYNTLFAIDSLNVFSENAADYGGAFWSNQIKVDLPQNTVQFMKNFANIAGGAVFTNDGTVSMSAATFIDNVAGGYGNMYASPGSQLLFLESYISYDNTTMIRNTTDLRVICHPDQQIYINVIAQDIFNQRISNSNNVRVTIMASLPLTMTGGGFLVIQGGNSAVAFFDHITFRGPINQTIPVK